MVNLYSIAKFNFSVFFFKYLFDLFDYDMSCLEQDLKLIGYIFSTELDYCDLK